jgi:hypothetical protein
METRRSIDLCQALSTFTEMFGLTRAVRDRLRAA